MDLLTRITEVALEDPMTRLFTILIVGWLFLASVVAVARPLSMSRIGANVLAITPNSLATLGVLGTFTGILIGLLDFDVNRIDESVPALLAGLKVAFTTSIVGIAAAIAFRVVRALAPAGPSSEGIGPEDIHAVLAEIRDDGRTSATRSAEQLAELRKAISSDGDGSLLTQMQKLRTAMQDGHGELIREFRDFAKHMVENNQKAIIEALEQVIRDFNQNLTEQFGENFKQLNEAVERLVTWQESYRLHVEKLEERLDHAVQAIEASQRALEAVRTASERIPETIRPLEPVLTGLQSQTDVLGGQLEVLAALRDKAIEAFPVVERNLETITTQLSATVDRALDQARTAVAEGQRAHDHLRQSCDVFLSDANTARERFSTELANALAQMSERTSQEFERHGRLIEESTSAAQRAMTEAWARSAENINQQFEIFDRQMQEELTRSLQLLGRNLASISEEFVSDYTPLTNRLKELVRMSQGAA